MTTPETHTALTHLALLHAQAGLRKAKLDLEIAKGNGESLAGYQGLVDKAEENVAWARKEYEDARKDSDG